MNMRNYFRGLLWIVKISAPLTVAFLPVLALYGAIFSWAPAETALTSYSGQTAIMIGAGTTQRSYILFPEVLQKPEVVTIDNTGHSKPQVTEDKEEFFLFVAYYLLCVFGTWWFWLRRASFKKR